MSTLEEKDRRRRNYEAKRLYEDKRFKKRVQTPKPDKEKQRKISKKELLNYVYKDLD